MTRTPPLVSTAARRFVLQRTVDETGFSGTGIVADGIEWHDGKTTVHWRHTPNSTSHWDSIDDMYTVHGHAGHTKIVWID